MKNIKSFILESNQKFDLSNLYDIVQSEGDNYDIVDIEQTIKDKWNTENGGKFNKAKFSKVFKGFEKCSFSGVTLEDRGEVNDVFYDTWGNDSYVDVLPKYEDIGKDTEDYDICVAWGVDKNGIFIAMIEDECGNTNLLLMTNK